MVMTRRRAALLVVAVCACAALPSTTTANKFSINWKPNTNYSDWPAQHGPFYKGDWLVFYYTAGQADVIQVDAAGYNTCDATNAISNYSKGRTYAFELNETKTYYFICSYGYCFGGMRLQIKTEKLPPPSPPAAAKDKSAAAFTASRASLFYAAAAAVLAAILRMF
ncbi:hypothetical protein OsI_13608 [Oryza sativa Indica Group]|uniref:Phytocyanin domain-containing protein n=4 Tax=Oryza TaxID=4527 RepID=A0A0D3FPB2_9ORYZ|nr:hypothetical protein OsI_13608 [Oryza sativa Indica Group]